MKRCMMIAMTMGLAAPALANESAVKDTNDTAKSTAGEVKQDVSESVFDLFDKNVVKVSFDKGQAVISDSDKAQLKAAVAAFQNDAVLDHAVVAAWSDESYQQGVELPKTSRDLAENRSDAIEDHLESLGVDDVDTHSMAEEPSWIAEAFNTDDAQLKKSMNGKAVDDKQVAAIADRLKQEGGPSTAVVILMPKQQGPGVAH